MRVTRLMDYSTLVKLKVCADALAVVTKLFCGHGSILIDRAAEIEYPIEAVVEMAIASFLDTEALGFVDCNPGRGQ
jgi:hypothetical protein